MNLEDERAVRKYVQDGAQLSYATALAAIGALPRLLAERDWLLAEVKRCHTLIRELKSWDMIHLTPDGDALTTEARYARGLTGEPGE